MPGIDSVLIDGFALPADDGSTSTARGAVDHGSVDGPVRTFVARVHVPGDVQ